MSEAEKHIQRDIQLALGAEPDLLLMRNQCGQATYVTDEGHEFRVPYGLGPGSPDLVGILDGRVFALEVKAHDGVVSPDQKKCHELWRRFGAHVSVVRTVAEAKHALTEARRSQRSASTPPSKAGRR